MWRDSAPGRTEWYTANGGLRKPRKVCGARTGQNGKGPGAQELSELTRVLFEGIPLALCGDHTEEGTGRRMRRLWRT